MIRLSVVVAATAGPDAAARAVASLGPLPAGVEVLVVHAAGPGWPARPGWIAAPAGSGVAALRRAGLDRARGRVVAFAEDSCRFGPGWADAWLAAFADPAVVAATGPVAFDPDAAPLDRAVALCEYAPFRAAEAPAAGRAPGRLAGNNFAVLRDLARARGGPVIHEHAILAAARPEGRVLWVAGAAVLHVRRDSRRAAFADRFRFGLEFGTDRGRGLGPLGRCVGLAAGPAIWLAQAARLARCVAHQAGASRRADLRALPWLLALLAAWSLGEWLGWSGLAAVRPRPGCRRRGTAARPAGRRPAPSEA